MEIEFKFCIPPQRLAAVQAAARRGRFARVRLEARYFDTPGGDLASRGIAFRLRREGDQWVQTVKALGDGPLDREEHDVVVGSARPGPAPRPRPQLHAGTVAGDRLMAALHSATEPLTETYCTEVDRITREIAFPGGVVELALDTGQVVAHPGTAQHKQARICELELELKAGPVAGLAAVARRWATRHGLFLSTVSKAERGERLRAAQWARPATRVQPMRNLGKKHFPHGRALQRAVVANCLQQILANASEIVESAGGDDAEHVHQLRIGIRRLRTALRELAPLAPGSFEPTWEPPLIDVFQRLGHLRDREQVLLTIGADLREAGAPAPQLPQWTAAQAPGASAADIVRTAAFQAALIGLMGFTAQAHGAAGSQEDAGDELDAKGTRRLLQKRLRGLQAKARKGGRRFATLPVDEQHRLRRRLKRLRYLTEFVAPALDAGAAPFLASLRRALSALGRLSDERVASALYSVIAKTDPTAWFAVGWLAARRQSTAAACEEALSAISGAPRVSRVPAGR